MAQIPFSVIDMMVRVIVDSKDLDPDVAAKVVRYLKKLKRGINKAVVNMPEFRLCPAPLSRNCCKDRSGDGHICGSVYELVVRRNGKIVSIECYPARHPKPVHTKAVLKAA